MGIELAKAFISVGADSTGARSAFQQIERSAEQSMANVKRIMTSVLGTIGSYMGASTIWKGLEYAGEFEETKVAFETMIGTAEETQKTLDDLTTFAAKTPFEMPGIQQVARGLLTFGERGDEMMDTLNVLGDASGGTAQNFQMLGLVFNQVRGVGKLLTQDFRQLSTRGIMFLTDIADYYGVTTEEAQEMLSKGKVAFEDVKEILRKTTEEGGRNFNMMERQSKTYRGLMSTLRDNIGLTFRAIGEGILPAARNITDAMNKIVDSFRAAVAGAGSLAGNVVVATTAIISLTTTVLSARTAMKMMGLTFNQVLIGTGWGIALVALGVAIGVVVTGIQKLYKWLMSLETVQATLSSASEKISAAWGRLKESLTAAGLQIWTAFREASAKILSTFGVQMSDLPATIEGVFLGLVEAVSSAVVSLADWLARMVGMWRQAWGAIQSAWENYGWIAKGILGIVAAIYALKVAMAAAAVSVSVVLSPLGLVAASIAAVGAAAYLLKDQIAEAFESSGFTDYLNSVGDGVQRLGSYLMKTFGDALAEIGDIFKTAFGGIVNALKAGDLGMAGEIALLGLQTAWSAGIGALEKMWLDFKVAMIETFAGVVIEIHKLWTGMIGGISKTIIDLASQEGAMGAAMRKILGVDPRELQKERDRIAAALDPVRKRNLEGAIAENEKLLDILKKQGFEAAKAEASSKIPGLDIGSDAKQAEEILTRATEQFRKELGQGPLDAGMGVADEMANTVRQQVEAARASVAGSMIDAMEGSRKARDEAIAARKAEIEEKKKSLKEMADQAGEAADKAEERRSKEAEEFKKISAPKTPDQEKEKEKEKKEQTGGKKEGIGAGTSGYAEFGEKIQEMIFKASEGAKTNDLLEKGNELTEQLPEKIAGAMTGAKGAPMVPAAPMAPMVPAGSAYEAEIAGRRKSYQDEMARRRAAFASSRGGQDQPNEPAISGDLQRMFRRFEQSKVEAGKIIKGYSIGARAATSADQMLIPDAEKDSIRQRDALARQAKEAQTSFLAGALATPGMSDFADFQSRRYAEQAATKQQFSEWRQGFEAKKTAETASAMSAFESWKAGKLGTGKEKDKQEDIIRALLDGNKTQAERDAKLIEAVKSSKGGLT